MNSRISTEYVSIESGRNHELLIVIFQKFLQISIQFLTLFGRHYGRNAQGRPTILSNISANVNESKTLPKEQINTS